MRRDLSLGVLAIALLAAPPAIASSVDGWAHQHLKPGTGLKALRQALKGADAYEVYTERIHIPATKPLAGRSGKVVAMVLFDQTARHERLVLFRETARGPVIDAVVHDARVSYSYREVFHQARYARQYDELERVAAGFFAGPYARFVDEQAIASQMVGDPWGGEDGVVALTVGGVRHVLVPFEGASIEDYSPARVFVAKDGRAIGTIARVGNGLPSAMIHLWTREKGDKARFVHVRTIRPTPMGP